MMSKQQPLFNFEIELQMSILLFKRDLDILAIGIGQHWTTNDNLMIHWMKLKRKFEILKIYTALKIKMQSKIKTPTKRVETVGKR